MEHTVAVAVILHGAQDVTCMHLLPLGHDDRREVAIDADVTAMTYKHILIAAKLEYGRDHSVKDGTCPGTRLAHIVDTLIVELHVAQSGYIIFTKVIAYHILSCDGYRQASLVLFEVAEIGRAHV